MPARKPDTSQGSAAKRARPRAAAAGANKSAGKTPRPKLLAGGNPQIAKADGDEAVQAYIAAIPGWKQDVARRLDELITRTVPSVRKAVRWNSPFYGTDANGWFLSFHCITRYMKVAFFQGASLKPIPPVESRNEGTRYFHIHEGEWTDAAGGVDEKQLSAWIKQASKLPGWAGFKC